VCMSGQCQIPLAAGCGGCVDDPDMCVQGTVCSSNTNTCTGIRTQPLFSSIAPKREYQGHLTLGETCVYDVCTVAEVIDTFGNRSFVPSITSRVLACGTSAWRGRVENNVVCDIATRKCGLSAPLSTIVRPSELGECTLPTHSLLGWKMQLNSGAAAVWMP
jgi:hypothetical protein